jgi:hypothetical protein
MTEIPAVRDLEWRLKIAWPGIGRTNMTESRMPPRVARGEDSPDEVA